MDDSNAVAKLAAYMRRRRNVYMLQAMRKTKDEPLTFQFVNELCKDKRRLEQKLAEAAAENKILKELLRRACTRYRNVKMLLHAKKRSATE